MLKLRIQDDGGEESEVPISRDEITIGRAEGNTIRLTARNVSRQHAKLIREEGALFIETISARYGIIKNGQRISDKRIAFGAEDVILIGDYRLILDAPKAPVIAAGEFSSEPTEVKHMRGVAPRRSGFEGTEILPAMPAKIVIVSSNFAGQEFPLASKEVVIGRGEECDIIVDHRSVSQMHAKIVREQGKDYQIVDLNSKNGVCIHGEKYTSTYLKRGDVVELGHVKFRFVEPGENYVFTPQSIIEDGEDDPLAPPLSSSGGFPKVALILGTLALLGLAGIGVLLLMESPTEVAAKGQGVDSPITSQEARKNSEVAPDSEDTDRGLGPMIAKGVERAKEKLADGEVDQAIGVLEGLKMVNPSKDELDAIETLIVEARAEKPFKADYILARTHVQDEEYEQALDRLKKIPDHTLFAKLAKAQEWDRKAQAGLLKQARQSDEDGEREEAMALVTTLLEYDPEDEGALTLRDDLKARVVAAAAPREPVRKQADAVKKPPKRTVAAAKLSNEEAAELRTSAFKKLLGGDLSGSIEDCSIALQNGVLDCHRLMGQAYEKQGDKDRACKYYRKAQKSTPRMKDQLQKSIDKLECDV